MFLILFPVLRAGQTTPYNRPQTTGGQSLSVAGANMGTHDHSQMARFGGTVAESTVWQSDSIIFPRVAGGVGKRHDTVITVASIRSGTAMAGFSFGHPELTGRIPNNGPTVVPGNGPTSGSNNATIAGFNFGQNEYSIAARLGQSAARSTTWISDSRLSGLVAAGACTRRDAIVTVAVLKGTQTRGFSYDRPQPINGTLGSAINTPSTGAMTLTLTGMNFGGSHFSCKARHHSTAAEYSSWMSDTAIFYKTPSGVGADLTGVFTLCANIGTATKLYSYDAPTVSMPAIGNGPTDGGVTVTLLGAGFGTVGYSSAISIGSQNASEELAIGVNASATACEATVWLSDTSSACRAAAGVGFHLGSIFTVALQIGTQTEMVRFSYDLPYLTGISSMENGWSGNGPTGGGTNVTLEHGGTTGFYSITMHGQDFAKHDYSGRAKLHDTDCMATDWWSTSSVACRIPSGECAARSIAFTVGVGDFNNRSHYGTTAGLFSYDAPAVSGVENATSPSTGGATIRLVGKNFGGGGSVDYTSMMRIGETLANLTAWYSDTYVAGLTPPGLGRDLPASLVVCDQEGTVTGMFSYFPPNITDVFGGLEISVTEEVPLITTAAVSGGTTLNVTGADFGQSGDYSRGGRWGGTAVEASEWVADSAMLCKVAAGVCSSLPAVMTVMQNWGGTFESAYGYDVPWVTSGLVVTDVGDFENTFLNGPTAGGTTISMLGFNFGMNDYSAVGRVLSILNGTTCEATSWVSVTTTACRAPAGAREDNAVEITVCAQIADPGHNGSIYSYDAPVVTSAEPGSQNGPTSGASSITLLGLNFGTVDYSNTVALFGPNETYPGSYTVSAISEWVSDSSMRAKIPPGVGAGLNVSLMFNGTFLAGTISMLFTYDAPFISASTLANGPTEGGSAVTISGLNFGIVDFNMNGATTMNVSVVQLGGTQVQSTSWTADTSILSLPSAGVCQGHYITATLANLAGTTDRLFSYDTPTLVAALHDTGNGTPQPNAPTSGGRNVTISGKNFGAGHYSGSGRIGKTAPHETSWNNDTSIVGLMPHGVCKSLNVTVSVCGNFGTGTFLFSYDAPIVVANLTAHREFVERDQIATENALNSPVTGGGTLTLTGSDFATSDHSSQLRHMHTAAQVTMWSSDSAMAMKVPTGERSSLRLVATVCHQISTSTISVVYAYDSPFISSVSKPNAPTSSGYLLSVFGGHFGKSGYSPSASLGQNGTNHGATSCETSDWKSDSCVLCRTPSGVAQEAGIVFTLGMQVGTGTLFFTYDAPRVTSASSNGAASGGLVYSFSGLNFGGADYTDSGRTGGTASEKTGWLAETSMSIKSASGVCHNRTIVITVAGGSSEGVSTCQYGTGTALFSYDSPSTLGVGQPGRSLGRWGHSNGPASGGHTTTIRGANFGNQDFSPHVRIGGSAVTISRWDSNTAITIKTGSGCGSVGVVVTVCNLAGSTTRMYMYDGPSISALQLSNSPTTGQTSSLTITGGGFGTHDTSLKTRVGDSAAEASRWISETSLQALTPAGLCSAALTVSVCIQDSNYTRAFSYDAPTITVLLETTSNSGVQGGATATVHGKSYGTASYSVQARVGGTGNVATLWTSDSQISARTSMGLSGSKKIVVTLCSIRGSITSVFTFDQPVVAFVGPRNSPTTAGVTNTVVGANLGFWDPSPIVFLGGTAAVVTFWHSNTALASKPEPGVGKSLPTVIFLGDEAPERYGTVSGVFEFDDNMVTALISTNAPAAGRAQVTVQGQNFGTYAYSGKVKLNPTRCQHSEWRSDSAIMCLTPSGLGAEVSVVATIADSTSSLSRSFSYDAPRASSIAVTNGPTSGGSWLSLSGINFGSHACSPRVSLGGSASLATWSKWVSDSSLVLSAPPGGGPSHGVHVEVCGRHDVLSAVFSYDGPTVSGILRTIQRGAPLFGEIIVSNSPQSTGISLTVIGENFGGLDLSPHARIGESAVSASLWISDSALSVKPSPGFGFGHSVTLTLATQFATITESFTIDAPVITSAFPTSVDPGTTVNVYGLGMGPHDATATVLFGHTACETAVWQSSTSVSCMVPPGVGTLVRISTFNILDARVVTLPQAVGYAAPLVTATNPSSGPQSGLSVVTLLGERFGRYDASLSALVGSTGCTGVIWTSESSISCMTSYGVGRVNIMVNESTTGSLVAGYKYEGPFVTGVSSANAPFAGGSTLILTGNSFGRGDQPVETDKLQAKVGSTACTATAWASETSAICIVSAGIGGRLDVSISLAESTGTLSMAFTYDGFFILPSFAANGPATGGVVITMMGQKLGSSDSPPSVAFGAREAQVAWTSFTSIAVMLPRSVQEPIGTDVTVSNAGRPMVLRKHFSYDAPAMLAVRPSQGERSGGVTVSIAGSNFGALNNFANISMGGKDCTRTVWTSDSSLLCEVPRSSSYQLVDVVYRHQDLRALSPGEAHTKFPASTAVATSGYEYRIFRGPMVTEEELRTISLTGTSSPAQDLVLGDGVKVALPEGSFSVTCEVTLKKLTVYPAVAPASNSGQTTMSDIISFDIRDKSLGTSIVPSKPIAVILKVRSVRRAGRYPSTVYPGLQWSGSNLHLQDTVPGSPSDAADTSRRLLEDHEGVHLRAAWLDKCAGVWNAICTTKYDKINQEIIGEIPPEVFGNSCFNPASGCTTSIIEAQQCNGTGGSVIAMAFIVDPCPPDGAASLWVILISSIGGALLLIVCVHLMWRYSATVKYDGEYYDEEEYGGSTVDVSFPEPAQQSAVGEIGFSLYDGRLKMTTSQEPLAQLLPTKSSAFMPQPFQVQVRRSV